MPGKRARSDRRSWCASGQTNGGRQGNQDYDYYDEQTDVGVTSSRHPAASQAAAQAAKRLRSPAS
jgi:hypothetical protein